MNGMQYRKPLHRIRMQRLEVEFENQVDAFKTRDELSAVCRRRLIPAMERLLDKKYAQSPLIRIPSLVIDVGTLDAEDWENALTDAVVTQLEQYLDRELLRSGPERAPDGQTPAAEHFRQKADFLLSYLKTGIQAWNSPYENTGQLRNDLTRLLESSRRFLKSADGTSAITRGPGLSGGFPAKLLGLLNSDLNAMVRLLYLVPEKAILPVLIRKEWDRREIRKTRKRWDTLLRGAGLSTTDCRAVFMQALGLLSERGRNPSLTLSEDVSQQVVQVLKAWHTAVFRNLPEMLIAHAASGNAKPAIGARRPGVPGDSHRDKTAGFERDAPAQEESGESGSSADQGMVVRTDWNRLPAHESVYISNAGLVLLHPFLHHLFENIGHTVKNAWNSPELRHRSLVLTQYLVHGKDEYAEQDLLLNKLLTGYPLEAPLPLDTVLSDFEKKEAEELLESVIAHWKALRNTGIAAFQGTFLQRAGKLSKRDKGWLLEVDQQVQDVLLGKIPWGFSTIKTPWMNEILAVEWA
ncbi:MAG: contractile injection system tape measure protein [Solitalea sp.]